MSGPRVSFRSASLKLATQPSCQSSHRYEKVKEREVVEALKLRADTIINEEALMSEADWANTRYFPEYLEVLQAKEPPVPVWSGVSGQISTLSKTVNEKVGEVEDKISALSKKVGEVEDKVSSKVEALQKELDAKLNAKLEELDAKLGAILKAVTAANGAPQPEPER